MRRGVLPMVREPSIIAESWSAFREVFSEGTNAVHDGQMSVVMISLTLVRDAFIHSFVCSLVSRQVSRDYRANREGETERPCLLQQQGWMRPCLLAVQEDCPGIANRHRQTHHCRLPAWQWRCWLRW